MTDKLFVYGRLKDPEHQRMLKINPIKEENGEIDGVLYQVQNPTKNLVILVEDSQEKYPIKGKVLTIEHIDDLLKRLDILEHTSARVHQRAERMVRLENGESVKAWVYLGNPNHGSIRDHLRKLQPPG